MNRFSHKSRFPFSFRLMVSFVLVTFTTSLPVPLVQAQGMTALPIPGVRVALSPEFTPPLIRGITVHPENPLQFDFLMSQGDKSLAVTDKAQEYERLIKYFLAALTVPEKDLWVNLSPYEDNRIISDTFGKTEMGRDLLAQDYLLKQITASLIYPEDDLGKAFWDKVYKEAQARFGTTDIPVNTFNKVWIVPDDAVIYEHGASAFVIHSHLKVMLEQDYLSLEHNSANAKLGTDQLSKKEVEDTSSISSQIVREIVIPALEKEVNEGKNFAMLRQVFQSVILAAWYKKTLRESLLGKVYVDQGKVKGVTQDDPKDNEKIYNQYVEAFKKGVFNYIKEENNPQTQEVIPRKYFSGGAASVFNGITLEKRLVTANNPAAVPDRAMLGFRALEEGRLDLDNTTVRLGEINKTGEEPVKVDHGTITDDRTQPEGEMSVVSADSQEFRADDLPGDSAMLTTEDILKELEAEASALGFGEEINRIRTLSQTSKREAKSQAQQIKLFLKHRKNIHQKVKEVGQQSADIVLEFTRNSNPQFTFEKDFEPVLLLRSLLKHSDRPGFKEAALEVYAKYKEVYKTSKWYDAEWRDTMLRYGPGILPSEDLQEVAVWATQQFSLHDQEKTLDDVKNLLVASSIVLSSKLFESPLYDDLKPKALQILTEYVKGPLHNNDAAYWLLVIPHQDAVPAAILERASRFVRPNSDTVKSVLNFFELALSNDVQGIEAEEAAVLAGLRLLDILGGRKAFEYQSKLVAAIGLLDYNSAIDAAMLATGAVNNIYENIGKFTAQALSPDKQRLIGRGLTYQHLNGGAVEDKISELGRGNFIFPFKPDEMLQLNYAISTGHESARYAIVLMDQQGKLTTLEKITRDVNGSSVLHIFTDPASGVQFFVFFKDGSSSSGIQPNISPRKPGDGDGGVGKTVFTRRTPPSLSGGAANAIPKEKVEVVRATDVAMLSAFTIYHHIDGVRMDWHGVTLLKHVAAMINNQPVPVLPQEDVQQLLDLGFIEKNSAPSEGYHVPDIVKEIFKRYVTIEGERVNVAPPRDLETVGAKTADAAMMALEGKRILSVDDDEMDLELLDMKLKTYGANLITKVTSVEEAERLLASGARFELILTDVKMPRMSGIDFIQKLRERKDDTPVIVLSASPELRQVLGLKNVNALEKEEAFNLKSNELITLIERLTADAAMLTEKFPGYLDLNHLKQKGRALDESLGLTVKETITPLARKGAGRTYEYEIIWQNPLVPNDYRHRSALSITHWPDKMKLQLFAGADLFKKFNSYAPDAELLWLLLTKDNRFAGHELYVYSPSEGEGDVLQRMIDFTAMPDRDGKRTSPPVYGGNTENFHIRVPKLSKDMIKKANELLKDSVYWTPANPDAAMLTDALDKVRENLTAVRVKANTLLQVEMEEKERKKFIAGMRVLIEGAIKELSTDVFLGIKAADVLKFRLIGLASSESPDFITGLKASFVEEQLKIIEQEMLLISQGKKKQIRQDIGEASWNRNGQTIEPSEGYRGFAKSRDRVVTEAPDEKSYGGIDLNSANLKLQIKRDDNGVPLALQFQDLPNINIEGFVPNIIEIVPVTNLPLLMGLNDNPQPTAANSQPVNKYAHLE